MNISGKAIVLSSIKYGDTSLIVKLFTQNNGLQTFMLRGVLGKGRKKIKPAYFQALTQLEIEGSNAAKGKLGYLKEVRLSYHYQQLHQDIHKRTIALFLAEVLQSAIREEELNLELFSYLEHALQWLDLQQHTSNFHLSFLIQLTRYLGFYPQQPSGSSDYFDLVEGMFVSALPPNPNLSGAAMESFREFLGTKFDAIQEIRMSNTTRQELLNSLILYFELHLQGFRTPRSLKILHEVFH